MCVWNGYANISCSIAALAEEYQHRMAVPELFKLDVVQPAIRVIEKIEATRLINTH